ncbi:hypothetical protein [Pseudomonas rhodesiae]|uniref:hypothetical protein n=1 Tax=Pseudomonas rhodesiae TaxID=76760 RepID=UPI000F472D2F|nr:hypothetical protein [Pseudomonas rhodesiae]ROM60913.1 hypothetical protein BK650_05755 [Pseudomonas rhodesiae]ROM67561.1 hypothetical protein BK651_00285 [Pseudomonas rhodesiae]
MKMKTTKPLYLGGKTLSEDSVFVTDEQHGRQLLQKGYAVECDDDGEPLVDLTEQEESPDQLTSEKAAGKPGGKKKGS